MLKNEHLKNVILGYQNPIRTMNENDCIDALSIALPICSEMYCGIRKNEYNENVIYMCIDFIRNNYSHLGAIEIKQAFEMAAANKFNNVDMKAYYGQFTISMLGDILSAYSEERKKALNAILKEQDKSNKLEKEILEAERKNIDARQKVIKEYNWFLEIKKKGEKITFLDWDNIPMYWAKILIEEETVSLPSERKKELWKEAKDIVLKQTRNVANDFTNLYEAKSARNLLKSFENSSAKTLQEKAEVVYCKLYVWEFLK